VGGLPQGTVKDYNPKGQISFEGNFKDGKRDGFVRNYYDSGQIFSEEYYREGQLDGEAKRYYMDGTVQYISTFKNGQKTSMKAYNKKGQLTYDKKYPYIE